MASRTITLHCDVAVKDVLCDAIHGYAHAAYPVGGSECSQVARYTLLEAAGQIAAAIDGGSGAAQVSRRLRTNLRAALEYYFDRRDAETGSVSTRQRALFAALLEGETVTAAELEDAVGVDAGP